MPLITEHGLAWRGQEVCGDIRKDFVKCKCGVKIEYNFTLDNPWDKLADHIKTVDGQFNTKVAEPEKPKHHAYDGTFELGGIKYVRCLCGWQKRLKPSKTAVNVWEGHRGFSANQDSKQAKQVQHRHGSTTTNKVKHTAKNFWYGGWDGGYKKANWVSIEPIAKEVFGGTFFVVSTDT